MNVRRWQIIEVKWGGHWEMDCIESGRSKGRACLLVLVERMSRQVLVFKLRSQTQKEVQRRLDQLEKKDRDKTIS